jgi:hypothetical protein
MRASKEVSIDLTAEDLLSHLSQSPAKVAKSPAKVAKSPAPPANYEDTVEIELTAAQMDALLSGRGP